MRKEIEQLFYYQQYNKLLEKLEDLEDVKLYDEAKRNDDGFRISIEEAFKIIEEN